MPPKGKGKAKAYGLANIDAEGITVKDIFKKDWKVGKPVGTGGFGRLYQATDVSNGTGSAYVIKIEPAGNGPLFSELSFYQRKAKQEHVEKWKATKKLKTLGMPLYISSGLHVTKDEKYRFMIIPQYKSDLQSLFVQCNKRFPEKTVINLMLQIIDVLEYLHTEDYVHADIKAGNLLLGIKDQHQSYLVDYGLACKYRNNGTHNEYKPDPRKAHDGTIEFTSIDAHMGCAPSRRGDMEILGYCALQWLCSTLPWESALALPEKVKTLKQLFMEDPKNEIAKLSCKVPQCLITYMTYVKDLEYDEEPSYSHIRKILKGSKLTGDGKLDFPVVSEGASTSRKRKSTGGAGAATPKRSKAGDKSSTPAAVKKSKATPADKSKAKATPVRRKPAVSKAKSTPIASLAGLISDSDDDDSTTITTGKSPMKQRKQTSKVIDLSDSDDDDTSARNKNNSAAVASKARARKRQSMDPRAIKAIQKAKTTATKKGTAKKPVTKPAAVKRKVTSSAVANSISPRKAAAMRLDKQASKVTGSPAARKSPRVTKIKSTATIAIQTSPGLQGLKVMKGSRAASKR